MAITPQTNIRLLKCPLNINNKHQINFASASSQANYFLSLPYIEVEECSYQRKENIIRFPRHIDEIMEYNYVMYQNENYSNKWFYAYIIDMTYKADNLTLITIGTDVWQTWQFDITFKESFVEREHIAKIDDSIYKNLEPEGLEFGEPVIERTTTLSWLEPAFIIAYSREPYNDGISTRNVGMNEFNGIPNGLYLYACGANNLSTKLAEINNLGLGQNIITIFSVPICALNGYTDSSNNTWDYNTLHLQNFGDWLYYPFTATPPELRLW